MKKYLLLFVLGLAFLTSACATTTSGESESSTVKAEKTEEVSTKKTEKIKKAEEKARKAEAKRKSKTLTHVFEAPSKEVHTAAIAALKINGFDISKNEPTMLRGMRPNKMGTITFGSGGEIMHISITSQGPMSTEVGARTKKTVFGIAGQKNWNDEIIQSITEELE